ncbi:hypothetical protein VSU19_11730 [Verrucomicrobiales bacterium BCK34]|nr:hypothetical protein [Verrucomicrobiales bacterium BCK34]
MEIAEARKLTGATVESVELPGRGFLTLHFIDASETLRIAPPWTFTSCLESVSSQAFRETGGSGCDLTGLEGARLTGFQSGSSRIDLQFGSITISTAEPQALP